MFDNNIFYDFHVTPAIITSQIAFNQAEEMHRMACQQAEEMYRMTCQQAEDNDYDFDADFDADFAATEAYIARLRAEIEN